MTPEPSLLIVGGTRPGRKPTYEKRMNRRMVVRLSDEQEQDLKSIAAAEGPNRDVSSIVRDAVDEYVADYRERRVFTRPGRYLPE